MLFSLTYPVTFSHLIFNHTSFFPITSTHEQFDFAQPPGVNWHLIRSSSFVPRPSAHNSIFFTLFSLTYPATFSHLIFNHTSFFPITCIHQQQLSPLFNEE